MAKKNVETKPAEKKQPRLSEKQQRTLDQMKQVRVDAAFRVKASVEEKLGIVTKELEKGGQLKKDLFARIAETEIMMHKLEGAIIVLKEILV